MSRTPKPLDLGNLRKVRACLEPILDQAALQAIDAEVEKNTQDLYSLALYHYRFASNLSSYYWRQKISRFYYSVYSSSKALRIYEKGEYSTEVKDHQRVADLPDQFPHRARFKLVLESMREDRNTCDYDHAATTQNLLYSASELHTSTRDFLVEVKKYIGTKGLILRGDAR